jgi:hypothetical protein
MREVARWYVKEAMWRWTADGVEQQTGAVTINAVKYNMVHLPNSAAAVARVGGTGLRHEHAVPRRVLAHRIIEENMGLQDIHNFLGRFCRAAIVTRDEDQLLVPRREMPPGWNWEHPYQRYINANLHLNNLPADVHPWG